MKRILFFINRRLHFLTSCRGDYPVIPPTETPINDTLKSTTIAGFYLLNEGNMGSNKATLDYYDYTTRVYTKNIFAATNPNVVAELGDVGNDLKIYGNKLYAVINCSNLVEIMDARTAKHLGMVEIANCRYIAFSGDKAYVSSYAGPVQLNPNRDQIGYIAEIDTATFQITRTVTVGYQPEELAVVNGKLYVANSGGYRYPNYDKTVSVIDLATFTEIKQIPVAINLHRLKPTDTVVFTFPQEAIITAFRQISISLTRAPTHYKIRSIFPSAIFASKAILPTSTARSGIGTQVKQLLLMPLSI